MTSFRQAFNELDAQERTIRLLEAAGVTEEAARVSAEWREASDLYWKAVAVDGTTPEIRKRYADAFDAYWEVYQNQAGVFGSDE